MVENLNKLTFSGYGRVLRDSLPNRGFPSGAQWQESVQYFSAEGLCFYRQSAGPVYLDFELGMTVLAVRREGETAYFYLDKPVCLPAGREFAILPYQTECSVRLAQPAGAQLEVLEPVTAAENLKLGDRLRVVGPERAIMRFTARVGNQSHKLDHPNIISIFVGIALGILAGVLPIAIPGIPVPVKLGLAGGPLIVAILLGRYGPNLRLATYTTNSASLMLRELGIAFFLASVGLAAGDGFLQAFVSGEGFAYMALGLCITMLPLLIVGYVARRFFSLNYLSIVGMMAGTTTDPPALAYAATLSEKNSSAVAYSTVYPLAMFLRILTGQALLLIFWAEL